MRSLREEQYHLLGGRLSQLHGEVEDVRSVCFATGTIGLLERLWLFEFTVYWFHSSLWSLNDSLKKHDILLTLRPGISTLEEQHLIFLEKYLELETTQVVLNDWFATVIFLEFEVRCRQRAREALGRCEDRDQKGGRLEGVKKSGVVLIV